MGWRGAHLFPQYGIEAGTFAIAGMGALFAATVRAPLTGIVLVLEMTDNYQLILPMIITCLGATVVAQLLGGKPLYSSILARTLQRQEAQLAREAAEKTGKEKYNKCGEYLNATLRYRIIVNINQAAIVAI